MKCNEKSKDIRVKSTTHSDDVNLNVEQFMGHKNSRTAKEYIISKQIQKPQPFIDKKEEKDESQ